MPSRSDLRSILESEITSKEVIESLCDKLCARYGIPSRATLFEGGTGVVKNQSRYRTWSLTITSDGKSFLAEWRFDSAWDGEPPQWGRVCSATVEELLSDLDNCPADLGGVGPPPGGDKHRDFVIAKIAGDWRYLVSQARQSLGAYDVSIPDH